MSLSLCQTLFFQFRFLVNSWLILDNHIWILLIACFSILNNPSVKAFFCPHLIHFSFMLFVTLTGQLVQKPVVPLLGTIYCWVLLLYLGNTKSNTRFLICPLKLNIMSWLQLPMKFNASFLCSMIYRLPIHNLPPCFVTTKLLSILPQIQYFMNAPSTSKLIVT